MKQNVMHITIVLWLCLGSLTLPAFTQEADTPAATTPRALQLPDISVIGDVKGLLTNREDADFDTTIKLDEVEIVFGSDIYPGVRGDLALSFHGPAYSGEVEEGYLTVEQFTAAAPVGGRFGIVRLPFGKVNPVHPHQWPYVTAPAVVQNLLGDHFIGNGFEVVGLVPMRGSTFLQAQLGRWEPRVHEHEQPAAGEEEAHVHELGAGFDPDGRLTLGRLWTSHGIGRNGELELGASGAFGRGEAHADEPDRPEVTLLGADVTWRAWLAGERRIMLQGEAIRREETHDDGRHRQFGYALTGTYRAGTRYELGTRYDWSEVPGHAGEHESYISAFATRFLNETTYTRLQATHGSDADGERVNELWLQLVFGFGPHAHAVQ